MHWQVRIGHGLGILALLALVVYAIYEVVHPDRWVLDGFVSHG